MYAIHTTLGFIIESRPNGEAGKVLSIFTRELGLVRASAQGIRLEKSKLRYHSQEYSFGEFSFVRGKEFWRLTNANELPPISWQGENGPGEGVSNQIKSDEKFVTFSGEKTTSSLTNPGVRFLGSEIISRIALLLRRLLHGEEPHPELFDLIASTKLFIDQNLGITTEQAQALESLLVFRILRLLGYIGTDKNLSANLFDASMTLELITEAMLQRKNLNAHINKALKESHL